MHKTPGQVTANLRYLVGTNISSVQHSLCANSTNVHGLQLDVIEKVFLDVSLEVSLHLNKMLLFVDGLVEILHLFLVIRRCDFTTSFHFVTIECG